MMKPGPRSLTKGAACGGGIVLSPWWRTDAAAAVLPRRRCRRRRGEMQRWRRGLGCLEHRSRRGWWNSSEDEALEGWESRCREQGVGPRFGDVLVGGGVGGKSRATGCSHKALATFPLQPDALEKSGSAVQSQGRLASGRENHSRSLVSLVSMAWKEGSRIVSLALRFVRRGTSTDGFLDSSF